MKNQQSILSNHDIRHARVRVVTESGNTIMSTSDAKKLAFSQGLDLVLINEKADPPICNIIDATKFRYEQKVKAKAIAKSQRENRVQVKEVQFKPNIDNHDFETKCRNIAKFIGKGNTVKLQVQFKGRERQHTNLGFELIDRVMETIDDIVMDGKPQFSGNRITAILKGNKDGS